MKQDENHTNSMGSLSDSATEIFLRARDAQGLKQSEVLRRVECWDPKFSQVQFWRIQNGKAHWTLDRFVFVAAALGLDPAMLLDRILREHDIMKQLRARDGPGGDADEERESDSADEESPVR